jgi:hypothetical protein
MAAILIYNDIIFVYLLNLTMNWAEFYILQQKISKDGFFISTIQSGSMSPLIPIGSEIKIIPCEARLLKRFDIVVFWHKDRAICHFLWHRNIIDGKLVTKNLIGGEDIPFDAECLLGKVNNYSINLWLKLRLLLKYKQ